MKSVFPFEIHRMEIVLRRRNRRKFSSGWIARNRSSSSFCMQAGDLSNAMYFFIVMYGKYWLFLRIYLSWKSPVPSQVWTARSRVQNIQMGGSFWRLFREFLKTQKLDDFCDIKESFPLTCSVIGIWTKANNDPASSMKAKIIPCELFGKLIVTPVDS